MWTLFWVSLPTGMQLPSLPILIRLPTHHSEVERDFRVTIDDIIFLLCQTARLLTGVFAKGQSMLEWKYLCMNYIISCSLERFCPHCDTHTLHVHSEKVIDFLQYYLSVYPTELTHRICTYIIIRYHSFHYHVNVYMYIHFYMYMNR